MDAPNLESIFHRARALGDPAERARYIEEICRERPELRSRLEGLLRADAGAGGFLEGQHTFAAPLAERPGQTIGRYKLLQLIGEGGFGAVFMAEQEEPVRRRVALKIIKPGMDSRMVAARFEAERQALALMDHPHIARVFDGGITDPATGARPYFVMEYVIGDPITKFADAHKLSIDARLNLFTQVCEAVHHAHTKGIIHRDLKPTNILVSMTDGKPFARVIDFGIAKATGGRLTEKTLFTEHRQLIGTPEYMSPEQAEGSPDIDTRTDVYALGVLLYELLTGATPFDANRLRSAAYAELQRIIKEEEPPIPSLRLSRSLETLAATAAARQVEPSKLGGQIKGELDWIVMKALDKDRARRYETPSQFATDVQRHLMSEPVLAAPPSAVYRARKFVRRNKAGVLSVSAVAIAVTSGGALALWGFLSARRLSTDLATANASLLHQRDVAHDALVKAAGRMYQVPGTTPEDQAAAYRTGIRDAANDLNKRELSENDLDLAALSALAVGLAERNAKHLKDLTTQRDAAVESMKRLACGLIQNEIEAGQIDLKATDPPGHVAFYNWTQPGAESLTALIRINNDNQPELVFHRGSSSAHPLQVIKEEDVDPGFVMGALNQWIDSALEQTTTGRKHLQAANASLRERNAQAKQVLESQVATLLTLRAHAYPPKRDFNDPKGQRGSVSMTISDEPDGSKRVIAQELGPDGKEADNGLLIEELGNLSATLIHDLNSASQTAVSRFQTLLSASPPLGIDSRGRALYPLPDGGYLLMPPANPGATIADIGWIGARELPPQATIEQVLALPAHGLDAPDIMAALGNAAVELQAKLRDEIRHARLAQADVYCARYKSAGEGDGATEEARAHLQDAIRIYEEYLGPADLRTVKAIWELGDNQTGADADLPHYEDAARRLESAGTQPDRELLRRYMILPGRYSSALDLAAQKTWIGRIAAALPSRVREDGPLYVPRDEFGYALGLSIKYITQDNLGRSVAAMNSLRPSQLLANAAWNWTCDYPWSWTDGAHPAGESDRLTQRMAYAAPYWQRIADTARGMLRDNPEDPDALAALAMVQRALGDPAAAMDSIRQAQSARFKRGIEDPTDFAAACITLHQLGRVEEATLEREHLRRVCANTPESGPAQQRLSIVEGLLHPKPSPEQQLAEETKQRRLAEADAAVLFRPSFNPIDQPPPDLDKRLEAAERTYREYFGRCDVRTAKAMWQRSPGTPQGRLLYAEVSLRSDAPTNEHFGLLEALRTLTWCQREKLDLDASVNALCVAAVTRHLLGSEGENILIRAASIDEQPGSLTGGKALTREEHRRAARDALARARALMAPAPDGAPSSFAGDEDAKALLAEAEALIDSPAKKNP